MGDLQFLRSRLVTVTGVGDLPLEGDHDVIFFLPRKKQLYCLFSLPDHEVTCPMGVMAPGIRNDIKDPSTCPPRPRHIALTKRPDDEMCYCRQVT